MRDYKYEASVEDKIKTLVHKMYDATVYEREGEYSSLLRELSFEVSMDDDKVDSMFKGCVTLAFFDIYDRPQSLSERLYEHYIG